MGTNQKLLDKWRAYNELRKKDYTWLDLYLFQKEHEPEKLDPESIAHYENQINKPSTKELFELLNPNI